ncbi:hypothetical protein J6590_038988 [Homalodisca vitripennis]|nr:hypothetical protein J6590_038988 [Homalodisca vitripennis]
MLLRYGWYRGNEILGADQNQLGEAGTLTSEGNPVTNSDRVKTPVVGAGSTDFGGSQMYDVANQAGVTGVDHLAPCMPTITSEAEGMKLSVTSEEALLRTLTDKINRLAGFILEKKNVHNEIKAMARGTIRAMKDFVKARHTIAKKSIACVDRTYQTSPFFLQKNKPPEREPRDRPTPPLGPAKKRVRKETKRSLVTTNPEKKDSPKTAPPGQLLRGGEEERRK